MFCLVKLNFDLGIHIAIVLYKGFTLVVSPMVSLMEDQIIQMEKLDVNAKMISSYSTKEETKLLFQVLLLLFIYYA